MLTFLVVLIVAVSIQLGTIAAVGAATGVTLRVLSIGYGRALFQSGVFRLGLIPTGGYVSFRDSREETVPVEDLKTALDGRSTLEQLFIILSGCVVLLGTAYIAAGERAIQAFLTLPAQALAGALSPLGEAQTLLTDCSAFIATASTAALFGVVGAKVAALNLLPFPSMNGGAALAVVGRKLSAARWWPPIATRALLFVYLAFLASWCIAFVAHIGKA
jgi:membrane-associated protease RseP (regulator of RpoE activity)